MLYGKMDWQGPGLTLIIGDVAFVSASPGVGGKGHCYNLQHQLIDSEKLPSNPCLPEVVGKSLFSWFPGPTHHPPLSRMHALLSLGPSITSEDHLQGGQSLWRKMSSRRLGCLFASWGHVTCRGKRSEGKEFNCSGDPEGPEPLYHTLPARSAPPMVLARLTWVLQPLPWQKWRGFCIHYLWFLVKFVFLDDHRFLLLLSFCLLLVQMSLRGGTTLVFSHFDGYKRSITKCQSQEEGNETILPVFFIYLVVHLSFIQSTNMHWTPTLCHEFS